MSQSKKDLVLNKKSKKNSKLIWIISSVALIAAALVLFLAFKPGNGEAVQELASEEAGYIYLPLEDFESGEAQYYTYPNGDNPIYFFVLQSSDGVIRAAFNACDVCYQARKGYRQEGDFMVCNNCGQRFASVRINEEKGGCNPSPLERTVTDTHVVISEEALQTGARYF